MGEVIHWELCKKLKFDHTTKWYMHNPTSVQENEMHKLLLDFEIQIDLDQMTKLRDIKKNKRTCRIVEFAVLADRRVKLNENETRDRYLDIARELKNYWITLNNYNSKSIIFPTKSCVILYSLCANLLHSLIMSLIVSSLSPHDLHLLFYRVLSILALT